MDQNNRIRLQTANGSAEGLIGVAQEVRIGQLQAKDVAVVVGVENSYSFGRDIGRDIDGLLGMSFLARYEATFCGREIKVEREKNLLRGMTAQRAVFGFASIFALAIKFSCSG